MMEPITKTASFKMRLVDYVFGENDFMEREINKFARKHGICGDTVVSVNKSMSRGIITLRLSWEVEINSVDAKQEQFDFSEASCQ